MARDGDSAGGEGSVSAIPAGVDPAITATGLGPQRDESAFQPGDIVAGRYHVRRFIAFGGMGEVYEVEDRELKEVVALKTIRADVANDGAAIERFKREILLARKVTHANVCRIFDLGVHAPPGRRPQQFLTMELLQGPTLAERARMEQLLTLAEARPIVEQMVAALEAAHREGIVHRDFKSSNVMLCPTGKEGAVRVVVTDFGLARGGEGDPFATNATGNVGMMGSPAYMAPEQVEGARVTRAADIYALGVVMFETVTGKVPFTGESAMSCAVKRLKEPAPSPRVHLPGIDPAWERAILRCLERDPAARFQSAGDVVRALDGMEATAPSVRLPKRPARRPRRWARWAAGALALLLAGGAGWLLSRRRAPRAAVAPTAAQGARQSIAVLGFKNLAARDDIAWLSTALAEMLTTEMGAGGELRTIPGESVARMKRDLTLADAESYAPDTLERIHKNLRADYVIVGSYVPLGDRFRLDVRLQSTATGETLLQVGDIGTEGELAALVQRTGARLRDKLRMGPAGDTETAIVSATLPTNPDAARMYAQGLAELRLFSAGHARELLERATALEPGFPQGHAALAEALSHLGYEARARDEARKAVELSGRLPEEERLRVEGLSSTIAADWGHAKEIYGRLFAMSPDSVEWGMRLAAAQFNAGDDADGTKTVAQLRAMPNVGDDPRVYMVLVQAALMNQSFGEVRENAARLAATGEARGAQSLVTEARQAEAVALWFEGELGDAMRRADEARQLAFQVGDRDGVAAAMTTKAFVLTERAEYAEARRVAQAALDVAAEVGSRRRIWLAEHVLARCGLFGGDLAEARKHYEASRQAAEEVGSKYGEALGNLGVAVTLAMRGELAQAEPIYAKMSLGFRLFAPKHNTAFLRYFRANLEVAQGDLAEARGQYGEALQLSERFGERLQGERARAGLALVALLEGKFADAEQHAGAAAQAFAKLELRSEGAQAKALVARARAGAGRSAEAQAALDEAMRLVEGSENVVARYDVALAQAEVLTVAGKPVEAVGAIDAVLGDAVNRGYMTNALELRLARAAALRRARRAADATAELGQLTSDAKRLGFGAVLRRAAALGK